MDIVEKLHRGRIDKTGVRRSPDKVKREAAAEIKALRDQLTSIAAAFAGASVVEISDDCGWSLSFCFGSRDKDRDAMHKASDMMRALTATAIASGQYRKGGG